jgi:hypothetical protein
VITLSIPEPTPSLNEHKWKHWSHHKKLRRHWSMLVLLARSAQLHAGAPSSKALPHHANVEVTRFGKRSLDRDNFMGGLKCLLDGLKDHRLIMDDDAKHMTLIATQKPLVKGDKPCTLVTITAGEKHA